MRWLPATRGYVDRSIDALIRMQDREIEAGDEQDRETYEVIAQAITNGTIDTINKYGDLTESVEERSIT